MPAGATYAVPFGRGQMHFTLPAGARALVAEPPPVPLLADPPSAIAESIARPVASAPLRALARPGQHVTIAVTDMTRDCPDALLLPPVLAELEAAGVAPRDITILIAAGMHRPSTAEERAEMLGEDIARRYSVIDHDASRPEGLVSLGHTSAGVPIVTNRLVAEADLLIATGLVEPHLYAGFSGGSKTVAIGCAGEETITYTHGPRFIEHSGTRLGRIEDNPFQDAVTEIGRKVGLRFVVNVVLDGEKRIVAVRSGEPAAVHAALVEVAKRVYQVSVPGAFDVAIGGVGYPKDSNLYQTSRVPCNLLFGPEPVVRRGGFVVVPAPCPEGAGLGVSELRFHEDMKRASSLEAIIEHARRDGYLAGGQRAFMVAKALQQCEMIVVGAQEPQVVRDLRMIPAATMEEAWGIIEGRLGKELSVLIVPHALLTLPVIAR
ncbi:MAG: nickel-dependent lactate racemase [Chloroflexi bacterium]|nr:nickel-dependent lactate racemase [Chloroflexota bacterium]